MKKILTCGILFLTISYHVFAQTPWQDYKDKLKKKSNAGDIEALGMLGVSLYWEGVGSDTSPDTESILEKSAQMGSVIARDVHTRKVLGTDQVPNADELRDLANKGNEVAQYLYAEYLINQNNGNITEVARGYLDKSAASNFLPAYVKLGVALNSDRSFYVASADERLKYLKTASDQGYNNATMWYVFSLASSGQKSAKSEALVTIEKLANDGFGFAVDVMISCYAQGDKTFDVMPDLSKSNYFIVKKYIPLTVDNDPLISGSPSKEEVLSAMIGDLIIFKRQPDLKLKEINLKRGDKLQSNGANGIPKGTEVYPIKISPIIKGKPVAASTVYYFYRDEFREWKFKQ